MSPGSDHDSEGATLDARGIEKSYGRTRALAGVDFSCRPGEVHSLLGENGSGKSTLVKTLSGVVTPDAGQVTIAGTRMQKFSPRLAKKRGVATVFQEVLVAPNCSVATNVYLGQLPWWRWSESRAQRSAKTGEVLQSLTGRWIEPSTKIEDLSLMRRHQVAIARALLWDPKVLVLDESTAALDLDGHDRLFEQIRVVTKRGGSVVFISHRLDEVLEISDRITVLRSGSVVETLTRDQFDTRHILELMSGPDIAAGV